MSLIENLAGIDLDDSEGGRVRLTDLWKHQAIVLCFVRQFG